MNSEVSESERLTHIELRQESQSKDIMHIQENQRNLVNLVETRFGKLDNKLDYLANKTKPNAGLIVGVVSATFVVIGFMGTVGVFALEAKDATYTASIRMLSEGILNNASLLKERTEDRWTRADEFRRQEHVDKRLDKLESWTRSLERKVCGN